MAKQINHLYEFGAIRLDATNRLLYKNGEQLSVQLRAIETLLVLVENARAVVSKDTLLDRVWVDVAVEEGALKRNISVLRKALGEEGRFIETLPKRGYRLMAEVTERWEEIPAYTVEGESSEIVLERRASLRITQDEEITDASDPQTELSSDPKNFPSEPISWLALISSLRRHSLPLLAASTVALLAVFLLLWVNLNTHSEAKSAPLKSIAVLPFKNFVGSPDEHFGIGMADVLITRLSSIKDLNVRPTSAVLKFNNLEQDPIAAGLGLGVEGVLEGSIHRAGDHVRVTARLVRVSDQAPIWAGYFDERAGYLLSIQNMISQQVTDSLALSLTSGEKDGLAKPYTESADAYQLYVKGRYHWNKRNAEGMAQAESYFRKAIERDPNFALAYLGLADTLSMKNGYNESEYAIERALELDDHLGEAYASRGFWKMFKGWRWSDAEADFKRAIELKPGYGTAHQWYATLLAITGRVEEAKAEMRRALEIDPTSHNYLADMGQMHYFAREYDEAETYCRKALEVYPDFVFAHVYLIYVYIAKGEDDKAFEASLKANKALHPSTTYLKPGEMPADERANREFYRRAGLKGVWRESIKNPYSPQGFSYYALLHYYALLGEKEEALDAMEEAYKARDFLLPFVNVDPLYDGLRSEPRFQAMLRRIGLAN
ncbi:MAG TPA: tetratricopeptide repeat protein [Blastocatellia bacterium]|nr:tetratricopeptide repeat protein [Blastocatellia bacterium]